jgi:hypothetical protein
MRTFLIILLIIAVIAGAIVLYLVLTTPDQPATVRFPLTASQRALVARVPASADAFALIPTAALLHRKLLANPVTRDAVERWTSEEVVPKPWLIGGADAVIWKVGKKTSYAIRLDPFRAFLVRLWLMSSTNAAGVWDGSVFVIGAPEARMDARAVDDLLARASGLPEGDVLVVQLDRGRGMYPPIGRPVVTTVQVSASDIVLTSRARVVSDVTTSHPPIRARHPRGALLSAVFARPPRLLEDTERLLGVDLSALIDDGGSVALYDVDAGTLLPRPRGVIAVPADEKARAVMQDLTRVAEIIGETRDTGDEILVSFDRESMPLYLKDTFVPAPWPATRWSMRIDAARITPILQRLGDNRGLRLVAPRIHRAARDLRRWISALEQARSIEAVESESGGIEELRVRIASK